MDWIMLGMYFHQIQSWIHIFVEIELISIQYLIIKKLGIVWENVYIIYKITNTLLNCDNFKVLIEQKCICYYSKQNTKFIFKFV